jgi:hypothetical protein
VSGYILSVDADFDLDDIWEYIAADRREDLTSYPVLFWPVARTSSSITLTDGRSRSWR